MIVRPCASSRGAGAASERQPERAASPGRLRRLTWPPWASTTFFTNARPIPAPWTPPTGRCGPCRTARRQRLLRCRDPWSVILDLHEHHAVHAPGPHRQRGVLCEYLTALSIRLWTHWYMACGPRSRRSRSVSSESASVRPGRGRRTTGRRLRQARSDRRARARIRAPFVEPREGQRWFTILVSRCTSRRLAR